MYSFNDEVNNDTPNASVVMATCMETIHDMLLDPMKDKLTPEEDGVLALVGITLKIIAEKAHALEKMEQGFQGSFTNENDFNRN